MDTTLPTDCGNSPRIGIVAGFVTHWAAGNADEVAEWLTDTAEWHVVACDTHTGPDAIAEMFPHPTPDRLTLHSVISHGRLASCDGVYETAGRRVHFSHAFRFAGAVKTSKIAEIRSYFVE